MPYRPLPTGESILNPTPSNRLLWATSRDECTLCKNAVFAGLFRYPRELLRYHGATLQLEIELELIELT